MTDEKDQTLIYVVRQRATLAEAHATLEEARAAKARLNDETGERHSIDTVVAVGPLAETVAKHQRPAPAPAIGAGWMERDCGAV